MVNSSLEVKFDQLMNRVIELELKVKCHEEINEEKNQNENIENLGKQIVEQNKHIEEQSKQIVDQKKQIENQDKEIGELKTLMVNQSKEIKSLQQYQNNAPINHQSLSPPLPMISRGIKYHEDGDCSPDYFPNYSPICTAFQWKFNPTEVKSGIDILFGPPFHNVMNAHCFQLGVEFVNNNFDISLRRYRGKYDHNVNAIKKMQNFDFHIHIFGKNGKLKIAQFDNSNDYSIGRYHETSHGWVEKINNSEIDSLTVDGFVHLHCFFGDIIRG